MKFLVDFMLGRLCRWLRSFGYDAAYFVSEKKSDLIYVSLKEDRIILTRDRRLSRKKAIKLVLVESDVLEEQLEQVFTELKLKPDAKNIFTRCIECNTALQPVKKESVKKEVPSYVFQTQNDFFLCPGCKKVYWKGTHRDLITEKIKKMNKFYERKNN